MPADIRLFVIHAPDSDDFIFEADATQHILAGARGLLRPDRDGLIGDDSGMTLSHEYDSYRGLTALYWAWKNTTAEYYGFCEADNLFIFAPEPRQQAQAASATPGCLSYDLLDLDKLASLGWRQAGMENAVCGKALLMSPAIDVTMLKASSVRDLWTGDHRLFNKDLDFLVNHIGQHYPHLQAAANHYLDGTRVFKGTTFIASRAVMDNYLDILFQILQTYLIQTDRSSYPLPSFDTAYYLGELFLGIIYTHISDARPDQVDEIPTARFRLTQAYPRPRPSGATAIPVVLTADDHFAPILDVCLTSLCACADPKRNYDLFILHADISAANRQLISQHINTFAHINLSFIDIGRLLANYDIHQLECGSMLPVVTFFRFFILDLFPAHSKIVYLDSDTIVCDDVAKIYQTDMGDSLIAAVLDPDYLGQLNKDLLTQPSPEDYIYGRYRDTVDKLGLKNPFSYFQAGVLLMNLQELRKLYTTADLLRIALADKYHYLDQDILNKMCAGRVHYLDMSWNVLVAHALSDGRSIDGRMRMIMDWCPKDVADRYLASRQNPRIVHYGGPEKPWLKAGSDLGAYFWRYAKDSPYYGHLISTLAQMPLDTLRAEIAQVTLSKLIRIAWAKVKYDFTKHFTSRKPEQGP
ncbi:MAG: DUF4422 domain-containing protein [Coriobacteriales bacterium]|jgi:lipopolysaccharide biosynthesis glycosyltransferase|nr:DUF4422 domain-containing protein [Coriobacteriales bacterium]